MPESSRFNVLDAGLRRHDALVGWDKIMKAKRIIAALVVLVALMSLRPDRAPDIHAEIQQHLLEAEIGSATTFHFARGSRAVIPDDTSTDVLLANLRSSLPDTRWSAAEKLAVRRDPRAVEAVIRAMRDPKGTLRVCVMASALGHLKDPRALGALTQAVFDPSNRDLRLCAIQSLGMIGDRKAVPALIKALAAGNTPIAAANAIARMGDERGVPAIIQAAGDPQLRLWMVMALGELGSPTALPYLASLEGGQKRSIRQAADEAQWKIARLSAPDKVSSLSAVLTRSDSANRRMWAAFRLGELKQAEAVPALIQTLEDKNRGVRGRSAAALVRVGNAALPALRQQAAQGHGRTRLYAAAILGYSGGQAEIPLLEHLYLGGADGVLPGVAQHSVELINRFRTFSQKPFRPIQKGVVHDFGGRRWIKENKRSASAM